MNHVQRQGVEDARKRMREDVRRGLPVSFADALILGLGMLADQARACPKCPHCIACGAFGVIDPRDSALTTNLPPKRPSRRTR